MSDKPVDMVHIDHSKSIGPNHYKRPYIKTSPHMIPTVVPSKASYQHVPRSASGKTGFDRKIRFDYCALV